MIKSDNTNGEGALEGQDVRVWQQQLIRGVLLALVIASPLAIVAGSYYAYTTQTVWQIPVYVIAYLLVVAVTFWRRVPYALQVSTFLMLLFVLGVLDFFQDGRGGSGRLFMLAVVGTAPLFFNRRTSVTILIVAVLTVSSIGAAFSLGWVSIPPSQEPNSTDPVGWISNIAVMLLMMALMLAGTSYLVPRLMAAWEQSRGLARDLAAQRADLERIVAERTDVLARRARYLEAIADVTRSVSSVLEVNELLTLAARQVSERLGFYHVGIFFIDPAGEWATLQATSSVGGQRMLARGHRLRVGEQGIVGAVAARGMPRVALDVGQDAVFFDNPDLPDTHSEMALPLRARDEVFGVLDVQSAEREAFSQDDISVLQTLADQVALAISNARLFNEAQESLAVQQRAYGELSGAAWRALLGEQGEMGFVKQGNLVLPAEGELSREAAQAIQTGQPVQREGALLTVPIKSGDQVIAVLDAQIPAGSGAWAADQITLLQSLVEQAAQALERARLYQDTQRRAAQERLLGEVTGRIRESLNMETMLRTAVDEIRQAMALEDLVIHLTGSEISKTDVERA